MTELSFSPIDFNDLDIDVLASIAMHHIPYGHKAEIIQDIEYDMFRFEIVPESENTQVFPDKCYKIGELKPIFLLTIKKKAQLQKIYDMIEREHEAQITDRIFG